MVSGIHVSIYQEFGGDRRGAYKGRGRHGPNCSLYYAMLMQ